MKLIKRYCGIIAVLTLLICGCSKNDKQIPKNDNQIPKMVRPKLWAQTTYAQGSDIEVSVRFPASDWDLVKRQKEALQSDDFWPWHVRINGEYYRLDSGSSPLFPPTNSHERTSHLQLNTGKELYDSFEWTPGEYQVAYVFKDIIVCHPLAPQEERSFDEWSSNEVEFRIVADPEQPAGADVDAQP